MGSGEKAASAWDDDWEAQADSRDDESKVKSSVSTPVPSRKERLAKHAESNRKLWESADKPETFHFMEARQNVPLKSDFKPTLQVLSRKPIARVAARPNGSAPQSSTGFDNEDDDDDNSKSKPLTVEELRAKSQRERAEKQKKYDEARQRLFGPQPSRVTSQASQESTTAPASGGSRSPKPKPRSKASKESSSLTGETIVSRPKSVAKDMSKRQAPQGKTLFDPNDAPNRTSSPSGSAGTSTPRTFESRRALEVPTRQPKPPVENGASFQISWN